MYEYMALDRSTMIDWQKCCVCVKQVRARPVADIQSADTAVGIAVQCTEIQQIYFTYIKQVSMRELIGRRIALSCREQLVEPQACWWNL